MGETPDDVRGCNLDDATCAEIDEIRADMTLNRPAGILEDAGCESQEPAA